MLGRGRTLLYSIIAAGCFLMPAHIAHASPLLNSAALRVPQTSPMPDGARASAPFAYLDFCRRHASECRRRGSASAKIKLTPKSWKIIQNVNSYYNRKIREVADGRSINTDKWSVPVSQGDCEDFAIIKRRALIQKGFPSSALAITVAKMRNGMGHAVLTVRTDKGDFVLDNLTSKVKSWRKAPYRWIKRQSKSNPKVWVSLR